jgi:hypothetical protein
MLTKCTFEVVRGRIFRGMETGVRGVLDEGIKDS